MEPKTWKLAIRLAKEGYTITQCINQEKINDSGLNRYMWTHTENGVLYAGSAYSTDPKWKNIFTQTQLPPMNNRGAVCFAALTVKDRIFVVSFGPAQIYLNSDAFERDFGLKVTLNSVNENTLISIDAKTPEDQSIQKRIQASHQSNVTAFGINVSQDLLKGVAGKPINNDFASLLAGSDTLVIHTKVDETTIKTKCAEILDAYLNNSYKTKFPWVDNVRPVRDQSVIKDLNHLLVEKLNQLSSSTNRNSIADSQVYLTIPEIIDHEQSANYGFIGFGRAYTDQEFPLPELSHFINLLSGLTVSVQDIKERYKIGQRAEGSGNFYAKWSVFKCLVYETRLNDKLYILSEGDWYQVQANYVQEINNFFNNLYSSTDKTHLNFLLDAESIDNESTYINRLNQALPKYAICLDQNVIRAGGWNSSIEVCDFYTVHKDFIHIKNETSSSTLSHLFMQGLVSAQAYKRSSDFRQKIKTKIDETNKSIGNTISIDEPITSNYRIVYAILRKSYQNGNFNLPFFSKVSLKATVEQLQDLNYRVGLCWIKKNEQILHS